jgi:hypothetical protein
MGSYQLNLLHVIAAVYKFFSFATECRSLNAMEQKADKNAQHDKQH